jgi:hypothetical protein
MRHDGGRVNGSLSAHIAMKSELKAPVPVGRESGLTLSRGMQLLKLFANRGQAPQVALENA